MTGFKDKDILKRHLSAFRNNNYKFKYMNYLPPYLMSVFIDRYKSFHTDSGRVVLLTEQANECAKHIKYCDDLFFPVALPDLTTDELLQLLMLYSCLANPEHILFEKYIDFSSGNIESEVFAIRLYIFYVMWFEPLFKPEFTKIKPSREKIIALQEKMETALLIQMEQRAFLWRIKKEIEIKLRKSPINYNLYYLIQGKRRGGKDLGEKYFLNLSNMCKAKIKNLFLSDYIEFYFQEKDANKGVYSSSDEKDAELNLSMAEEIKKIDDRNSDLILLRNSLDQKFKYFTMGTRNRFINLIKKYTAQMRTPPQGGLLSLESPIPKEDDDGIPLIEYIKVKEIKTPQQSPIETYREVLQSKFGKKGVVILEYMDKNDLTNKTQKEIAINLGCTPETLRKYLKMFRVDEFLIEILNSD